MYRQSYSEYPYKSVSGIPKETLESLEEVRIGSAIDFIPVLDGCKPGATLSTSSTHRATEFANVLEQLNVSYFIEKKSEPPDYRFTVSKDPELLKSYRDGECHIGELLGVPEEDFLWWKDYGLDELEWDSLDIDLPNRSFSERMMAVYTSYIPAPTQAGLDRHQELAARYEQALERYEKHSGIPIMSGVRSHKLSHVTVHGGGKYGPTQNPIVLRILLYLPLLPYYAYLHNLRSPYIQLKHI